MTDSKTPPDAKKPEDRTASEVLDQNLTAPLHEKIFGADPDGGFNDTPRGAIGANVNLLNPGAQTDGFAPMTAVGDTDRHH